MLICNTTELYNRMTDSLGTPIASGDYVLFYGLYKEYGSVFEGLYIAKVKVLSLINPGMQFKSVFSNCSIMAYSKTFIFKITSDDIERVNEVLNELDIHHSSLLHILNARKKLESHKGKAEWLGRDLDCGELVMYLDEYKCNIGIVIGDNRVFNTDFEIVKVTDVFKLTCTAANGYYIQVGLKQAYLNMCKLYKYLKFRIQKGDVFISKLGCLVYLGENKGWTILEGVTAYNMKSLLNKKNLQSDIHCELGHYDYITMDDIEDDAWKLGYIEL